MGHLGAISLKLPNFLTTSQDVTKGADQAICNYLNIEFFLFFQEKKKIFFTTCRINQVPIF